MIPTKYCLVKGAGEGLTELNAFDRALSTAGVGDYNLVRVSSILPPNVIPGDVREIAPGSIVYAAMHSTFSDEPGQLISAAVAAGIPADSSQVGVLMEAGFTGSADEAEVKVREMVQTAMTDRAVEILRIESCSIDWRVKTGGSVFAAVLLW